MAYIRQYKGKWRAEVQKHGHRVTQSFEKKRDAQSWALRKEDELEALAGSGGKTLQGAVTHYLKTVSVHKADPEWERRRFDAMMGFFGADTYLTDITSETIGEWRDHRLETVAGSTVLREANLLRNLFTVATDEWRWIARNPFKGVRMPQDGPARTQVWKWQQIKRVLRAPRVDKTAEMQRAFHIALHTGLRLQEVLLGRYDPARRVYIVPKSKTEKHKTVEVPVTRRAHRIMSTTPFIVSPNEGSTLFCRLCEQLLIEDVTFHDARASALTWLSRRMDVMTLARISRHKDLKILLNTYYRETAEQIAQRLK